VKHRSFS